VVGAADLLKCGGAAAGKGRYYMWQSRKFRILVFDTVISAVTFGVTLFLAPDYADKVLQFIGIMQPLLFAVVVGIAAEDAALKRSGSFPEA